jgi:hypothetical protein
MVPQRACQRHACSTPTCFQFESSGMQPTLWRGLLLHRVQHFLYFCGLIRHRYARILRLHAPLKPAIRAKSVPMAYREMGSTLEKEPGHGDNQRT